MNPSGMPTEPTLAEDVLLMLFQPKSGVIAGENILFYVLGGAVLTDLGLAGQVESRQSGRSTTLHVLGAPPTDALMEPAWSYIAEKPRGVQTVLAAVGPRLREPVLDRMVERGHLHRESRKRLRIFTSTTMTLGSDRREELIGRVRATLIDGKEADVRTAASIALLSASGTLPQFDAEIPWGSDVYTRGKAYEQGDWGGAAAASAVARTMAAVVSNTVVAAIVLAPRP